MPHIFGKTKVICWLSHKFVHNKTEKSALHWVDLSLQIILRVQMICDSQFCLWVEKGSSQLLCWSWKSPWREHVFGKKKARTLTHNICLEAKTKNSPVGLNGGFCAMQCNLYRHHDFLCPQSKSWPQKYSLSTFQTNLSFIHNIVFPDWKEGFEIWCFIS